MKHIQSVVGIALLAACGAVASSITITVVPTLAPNMDGSPNWDAWVANSLTALENNESSAGTPGTPSYYQAVTGPVADSQTIVTDFSSWMGQADPAAPYDGEYGNRLTFGLAILGNGTQFSISQLGFDASSNDPNDVLGFGGVADDYGPGGYDYSSDYVGVIFGTDGNPNTYVTGGPDTQLVDALFSRGSGNSMPAYCAGCDQADEQAAIDAAAELIAPVSQFTGTYYLSNNADESGTFASGSGTFDLVTPEPAAWLMMLGGGAVVGWMRRRKAQ